MRLTVIRNDADVTPGHLTRVAEAHGIDVEVIALDEGAPLPPLAHVEAIAVLGGEMGAYDTDRFPFLVDEKDWLAEAARAGIPVLGICLGCQLLADALGGSAFLADRPEVAFDTLDVLEPDPVVDVLGRTPSLWIHRDTFSLPPGARLIARSDRLDHAFRSGSVLGIQAHPEIDPSIIEVWTSDPAIEPLIAAGGHTPDEFRDWVDDNADDIAATADELFGAWFDEAAIVVERRRVSRPMGDRSGGSSNA